MDHLQFLSSESEPFPGVAPKEARDNNWKNTLTVAFNSKPHTLLFASRTISGGDKVQNEATLGSVGFGQTASYTEYDIHYEFNAGNWGTASFGIKNLFNTDRPLDDTIRSPTARLNTSVFDPIGRLAYLGYQYNF